MRRGGEVWRELILLFYRMPPLFLGLLEDPERAGMQSLLQGRVYEPRDSDVLAELQARALELERESASSAQLGRKERSRGCETRDRGGANATPS